MIVINNLENIHENKYYFYEMFREYLLEFDTKEDVDTWVKSQKESNEYFGYDGYWVKDGHEAKRHFSIK